MNFKNLSLRELREEVESVCVQCLRDESYVPLRGCIEQFPDMIPYRRQGQRQQYPKSLLVLLLEGICREESSLCPDCLPSMFFTERAIDLLVHLWALKIRKRSEELERLGVIASFTEGEIVSETQLSVIAQVEEGVA